MHETHRIAGPRRPWAAFGLAAAIVVLAAALEIARPASTSAADNDSTKGQDTTMTPSPHTPKIHKTEAEWRRILTSEEYRIAFEKGTEPAFSCALNNNHESGIYHCVACGEPLFGSREKFNSGTGWPSYFKPLTEDSVTTATDTAYGMRRTEVMCSRCGAHLGHVFEDGPPPTGLRYCINGTVLKFEPAADPKARAEQEIKAENTPPAPKP